MSTAAAAAVMFLPEYEEPNVFSGVRTTLACFSWGGVLLSFCRLSVNVLCFG